MTEIKCDNCRELLKDEASPGFSHYFCSSACRFSWSISHAEPDPWKPYTERYKEQVQYREATSDRVKRQPPPERSEVRERFFSTWYWLGLFLTLAAAYGGLYAWAKLHPEAIVKAWPFTIHEGTVRVTP